MVETVNLHTCEVVLMKNFRNVKDVVKQYREYAEQLQREEWRARKLVEDAKKAMREYHMIGMHRIVLIKKSQLEALCDTLSMPDAVDQVKKHGWSSVFFPLWFECGWVDCLKKRTFRHQMMCQHLVSRYFLHLNEEELEKEKKRWVPDNFADCDIETRERLQGLATELVEDIDDILEQRAGGKNYVLREKLREWYF